MFVERIHQVIGDAVQSMQLHSKTWDDITHLVVLIVEKIKK
jgi:hypothetical protein